MSGPDTGSIASNNTNPSDTEDKLNTTLRQKSRQTAKRKRRATGNNAFGETLLSLLQTEAPSNLPLALKPSFVRKRNNEKLEEKARKLLQAEKKEKQDQARVTDLIGGWGGEGERALRKVAQRGVVKLFNVIQQSQTEVANAQNELKPQRGTGKPTPNYDGKSKADRLPVPMDQGSFFDMIKSGGVVSKV